MLTKSGSSSIAGPRLLLLYDAALLLSALADASAEAACSAAAATSGESPGGRCSKALKAVSVETICPALNHQD